MMSPSPKSQVMYTRPHSRESVIFFRIFGINSARVRSLAFGRRVHNVWGVTAGLAPHNSSNLGVSLRARWDTILASTEFTSPCVARVKY